MTLATRRQSLDSPYHAESEASRVALFADGRPPRNLAAAIAWFREQCANEIPTTLHKSGVWRDYGMHAEGGSVLGSPAPSEPFRRFIENSPNELNEDGHYVRPVRAALYRMSLRWPLTARHLFRLALVDGDWRRHAANEGFHDEEMAVYIEAALMRLWEDFATGIRPLQ